MQGMHNMSSNIWQSANRGFALRDCIADDYQALAKQSHSKGTEGNRAKEIMHSIVAEGILSSLFKKRLASLFYLGGGQS